MWGVQPMGAPRGRFEATYRCYPVSFIDKTHLENGDKVILPPSALDRLASLMIDYPMLFQVESAKEKKTTHCGVLEFVADEGHAYMPYWMMQNLLLREGDIVRFRSISLPKGTYVKLRPHTSDFLDISNPKAVLEMTLRSYSCLTKGDVVLVSYNNKRYFIDIVEVQPGDAVTIIETDCEVDFAPPLDYKEPVVPQVTNTQNTFSKQNQSQHGEGNTKEGDKPGSGGFLAFGGQGCRLDGKKTASSPPISIGQSKQRESPSTSAPSSTQNVLTKPNSLGKRAAGKLVFGRDAKTGKSLNPDIPKPPPLSSSMKGSSSASNGSGQEKQKEEEEVPTFKAFSGKSYKLA